MSLYYLYLFDVKIVDFFVSGFVCIGTKAKAKAPLLSGGFIENSNIVLTLSNDKIQIKISLSRSLLLSVDKP